MRSTGLHSSWSEPRGRSGCRQLCDTQVQTCLLLLLPLAPLGATRGGWLGRMVAYHKKNFIDELARLPVPITVTVERAPADYVDAPGWDFGAVLRLVLLIEVLGAEPARQAVHFALAPSRRSYLPFGVDTYQLFPSWSEYAVVNENIDTMNYAALPSQQPFDNDTVVYIDNPLEARLPSPRITIRKLREIMEQEALERRNLATTTTRATAYSFTHKSTNPNNATDTSEPGGESGSTVEGSTAAEGDGTTSATDEGDHHNEEEHSTPVEDHSHEPAAEYGRETEAD